jgi:predicted  nucleic acid-binding Zn ribbon protein
MMTVHISFRARESQKRTEVLDKVQSYLATLRHNGQIAGDMFIAAVRGGYVVTASVPETGALGDRFANKWVRKRLRELTSLGVDRKVTELGAEPESLTPCRCRKRPFLILFTTCLTVDSPVRCGVCFGPIALYRLPATNEVGNHEDMLWWLGTYQAMDRLFIGSGAGERFAHDQLSRFDSELSEGGRELTRALEKKVRVPVYYFLSKYFGASDRAERKRGCPSCGRSWLRKERLHRIFDFQCRPCRLLGNVAFEVRVP